MRSSRITISSAGNNPTTRPGGTGTVTENRTMKTVKEIKAAFAAAKQAMGTPYFKMTTYQYDGEEFLRIGVSTASGGAILFTINGERISASDLKKIIG